MSIQHINGNLVTSDINVFVHQCNCFATMGAGIARQIVSRYPEVKVADRLYQAEHGSKGIFGTMLPIKTYDCRICVDFYSQYRYGRIGRFTDYDAFQSCLDSLVEYLKTISADYKVGFPYMIGCGLAGGDWDVIYPMIERFASCIQQNVYIVKFSR